MCRLSNQLLEVGIVNGNVGPGRAGDQQEGESKTNPLSQSNRASGRDEGLPASGPEARCHLTVGGKLCEHRMAGDRAIQGLQHGHRRRFAGLDQGGVALLGHREELGMVLGRYAQ